MSRRKPASSARASHVRSPILIAVLLVGCASAPKPDAPPPPSPPSPPVVVPPPAPLSPKYYKDDGLGDTPPADFDAIPDAVPALEPLHRFANRPYTVLGRDYVPATTLKTYRERGVASWYGRKFHGQKTSTGETYDMYAMTAAHPTLALPSYARVTNVANGRSVIVRVNDRGPFLHNRIIDLSYAAAHKLGIALKGSGEVEVQSILPAASTIASATPPLPPVVVAAATIADASSSPDTSTAAASPPVAAALGGFAVQLGAFANFANAQNFLAHVQNQLAAAQVEAKVRQAGALYRVYVGPYPDRDTARRVGERLFSAFGFATTVAPH
jgi:peptidoglycan lytic transglycosylase